MGPKYLQIMQYVLERIKSGKWPEGCMLPTEIDLCKQFGVSRTSVRTAMLKLVNDGYINRTKGKGTFVTKPPILKQTTIFIESFTEEIHKQGKERLIEVLEFRIMIPEQRILEALQLPEGSTVIRLVRLNYIRDSFETGPIMISTDYFPGKFDFMQSYDFEKVSTKQALKDHGYERKSVEKRISIATLSAKECRLMGVPENTIALSVNSYKFDKKGNLINYCESLYPAERNEFILKIPDI